MPTPSTQEQVVAAESIQTAGMHAMGMLASGRAWLIFLISLAVLLQVGLFAAANWGDVLHKRPVATEPAVMAPSADPGVEPAEPVATQDGNFLQNFWPAAKWQHFMVVSLPIAGFVAVIATLILVVLTIVGIQVNLVCRLPALPAVIGAFYWSIVTVVLILPWGRLLGGSFAERVPWVFCTYGDIDNAVTGIFSASAPSPEGLIWLRFLAWPAVTLLAAWICGARFGNAYWQVVGLAEMEAKARTEQAH